MTIRHHPDEILLAQLAAGGLAPAFAVAVRAHLDLCPECRHDMAALEAAGGAILDALAPAAMDDGALHRALARIEAAPAPVKTTAPAAAKSLGFGLWYRPLYWDKQSGARAYELHVPAGVQVPMHSHRGQEMTCILQGSFVDETGRYGPGDFVAVDETLRHSPHAGADAECVCIIGTGGPLRMQSLAARAFQLYARL